MKNTTLLIVTIIVIVLVGVFLYSKTGVATGNDITGNAVNDDSNDDRGLENAQKVLLGMKDYNYFPSVINVKAGLPVEITLDETVRGCLRSFSIRDLGFSKFSRNPGEKIVFTPNKKGSFAFSCSMGMGYGTINVG